jgi:hypothetical protein
VYQPKVLKGRPVTAQGGMKWNPVIEDEKKDLTKVMICSKVLTQKFNFEGTEK